MMTSNFENYGVTGTWVKSEDCYGRKAECHDYSTVDGARWAYQQLCQDDNTVFVQFGAKTIEGPIVLGEYRPAK